MHVCLTAKNPSEKVSYGGNEKFLKINQSGDFAETLLREITQINVSQTNWPQSVALLNILCSGNVEFLYGNSWF